MHSKQRVHSDLDRDRQVGNLFVLKEEVPLHKSVYITQGQLHIRYNRMMYLCCIRTDLSPVERVNTSCCTVINQSRLRSKIMHRKQQEIKFLVYLNTQIYLILSKS